MLPYVLYFIAGGTVVTTVAYVGKHGDGMMAAFVASLPVLFVINVFFLYRHGGVDAGMSYARGALLYLPMFVGCVLLTMVLLPRIGMPGALLAGLAVYALPAAVRPYVGRRSARSVESLSELQSANTLQATGHAEEHDS